MYINFFYFINSIYLINLFLFYLILSIEHILSIQMKNNHEYFFEFYNKNK